MAKTKGKKTRYPVQRHMEVGGTHSTKWNVLDVAKFLSECNHRLYRQSRVYKCKLSKLSAPGASASYAPAHVYVLRDTWMLQKAYQFAKDAYDKNMTEERADISPANVARWQDFRIGITPKSGSDTNLLQPIVRANSNLNTSSLGNGEFTSSAVYKENGDQMFFGFWSSATQWSIVEEYDKTADTDQKPSNTVTGADINPYGALDDDNQQAARNDLQTRGNAPPYDPNSLDGDKLFRRVATIGAGAEGHKTSTGFFEAPLGVILIIHEQPSGGMTLSVHNDLELEVAAGDYKGIHGEKYIETKKFGHRRA